MEVQQQHHQGHGSMWTKLAKLKIPTSAPAVFRRHTSALPSSMQAPAASSGTPTTAPEVETHAAS